MTSDPTRPDVLIVGGGPAGSATGIELARRGVSVRLVDRAIFPRDKACSEYMSPEAVRHLDRLGVLPELEALGGAAVRGTEVTAREGARLVGLFDRAAVPPFRATGLSLARTILDHTLLKKARAAGVVVDEGATVTDLELSSEARPRCFIRRHDESRTVLEPRLVVGADGLRSMVRKRLGRTKHTRLRRLALVAHVDEVAGLEDRAELHVGEAGYAGLNPLGGKTANVAVVVSAESIGGARGRVEDFWFDTLESIPGVRGRIRRERIVRPVLVTGPFGVEATRVIGPGALLVGDAADFFDPFTGEGIYAALRGATLAVDTIIPALGSDHLIAERALVPYRTARRHAFRGKWIIERVIGYGMELPRRFDRAVARIEHRGLAHTLIGVTGDFVPPHALLTPRFLGAMLGL